MLSYLSINDIENRGEIFLGEPIPKKNWFKKTVLRVLVALLVYISVFACIAPFKSNIPVVQLINPFNLVNVFTSQVVTTNSTEVFEIKAPVTVPLGSYVAPTGYFNETIFTGSSISAEYEAPEVFNFTGVVFDLNFTVEGPQEPVVFEIYVDEFPIWRTSTPNSFAASANSSTLKNITDFLPLFESDSVISLQLIDGSITGNLNVSLGAVFYNDSLSSVAKVPTTVVDVASIFYPEGPADFIFPLSNKGSPFELPKSSFSVSIPQVAENVTSAKVEFFASASEEESRFYSSAINGPTGGTAKGPIRTLNVYLNSMFVGAISPNPALLKSDKIGEHLDASYAWTPLAAPSAFDALSYEIDLTAFLPILWEDESSLVIEVVSPVKSSTIAGPPSIPGPVSPPGVDQIDASKWLIAGNFFAWSSALVNASVGEILLADSLVDGTGILIAPPFGAVQNQIVRSSTKSGIQSQLNFTLADGSLHNLTLNFNSSAKSVAIKNTKLAGASTKLTYVSSNKVGISISDLSLLPIYTKNVSTSYPLVISEMKATPVMFGPPTNNSLEISLGYDEKVKINGKTVGSIKNKANSTIDDLTYSTEFSVFEKSDSLLFPFTRKVTAENGIITKDSDISKFMESEILDLFNEQIEFLTDVSEFLSF